MFFGGFDNIVIEVRVFELRVLNIFVVMDSVDVCGDDSIWNIIFIVRFGIIGLDGFGKYLVEFRFCDSY